MRKAEEERLRIEAEEAAAAIEKVYNLNSDIY